MPLEPLSLAQGAGTGGNEGWGENSSGRGKNWVPNWGCLNRTKLLPSRYESNIVGEGVLV